ncbi:MAG: hypothetical protein WCI67_04775 [Chloroflexales bacterium]
MSDPDAVPAFLIPGVLTATLRRALPDASPTAINVLTELLADVRVVGQLERQPRAVNKVDQALHELGAS